MVYLSGRGGGGGTQSSLVSPTFDSRALGPESRVRVDITAVNSSCTYQAWADSQGALVGDSVGKVHMIHQIAAIWAEASKGFT